MKATEDKGKALIGKIVRIVAEDLEFLYLKTGGECRVLDYWNKYEVFWVGRDDNNGAWLKRSDFELIEETK